MNSLVSYEDSDSDREENVITNRIKHTVTFPSRDDSSSIHSDFSCIGRGVNTAGRNNSLQDFEGKVNYISGFSSSYSNTLKDTQLKRGPSDYEHRKGAIKPYIPKRLRQEQPYLTEEAAGEVKLSQQHFTQSNTMQNVFRVSDYLKPFLLSKYNSTEMPRNLVFDMCEHTGPVNRVQWNSVKQYSHLLLSASMDSTVKIWDGVDFGKCLSSFFSHSGAVRDAQWSTCGQRILSGGFDSMLYLTDVETGKPLFSARNEFKIGAVRFHPNEHNLFICGGFSPALRAWDIRTEKMIHVYKAAVQQHFEILFLPGGKEFVSTTDCVSRDSADRTIIAWDFNTAAKISNQIFHERYTCPSLALHPKENIFAAQTNGNYMALFSTQRPYKMDKKRRFEGHKVEGFAVGCEFSPDGSLLVTGSSEGTAFFYNYHSAKIVHSIYGDGSACISVNFHPVLNSLLVSSYWDGHIRIWQ
ncbi:hypothetical protein GDO86_016061 [Hymenochirus boettgeri]|uniref:WD repeat-containing protein 25 n=1 Tax=Hymenochirus boettgeri TaxID=247094 RepID=A0A8T2K3V7_9PIPI|nr:hypothetical protein GDO86_016061 [Hymenochirus boettgeri]